MSLIAKDSGDFELVPEGVHLAICYGVIDLGEQFNEKYEKYIHKTLIQWELPSIRIDIEEGSDVVSKPKAVSRRFTLSLSEKSHLRPFLESWRGKKFTGTELAGFDIQNLLGVNCQIQILHEDYNGKTYANVHSVIPIATGTKHLPPENRVIMFAIEGSGIKIPENMPEWIEKIIMKSREWGDMGISEMGTYPEDHGREEPPMPEEYEEKIPF